MGFDPEAYKQGFDAAEPDYGDDGSPVPRGWYPLRLFPVKIDETRGGIPRVLVSATVVGGPKTGRQFLQEFYLKAASVNRKKDPDTNEFVEELRSEEEIEQKNNSIRYRMKGFMDAAGIQVNEMASSRDENEFLLEYFNVNDWKNVRVMGNVDIQNDRNRVKGWASLDHEKYGLEAFNERLEKQNKAVAAASV